ncbi:protein-disulfide isomerase [Microbacterium endophyticum]|uniref:Protein-disulfide isomerase n=1 Tax=Microbacterium endophyticum TaxID=1526412 RepID=A0A7W4V231_9MICO|nr:thioredoxin domain-containing protein [Microbacterium endophyticum]MBB2975452.1 protein-disulfide isomerase [Microbacterium endophyticum]NIK35529.1 protein-disulfide isomerase [Microbacterium endophyticum]
MAAAARKVNTFVIGVTIAVVVVLGGVTALVVWMNNAASDPGVAPEASNVNTDTGAIVFGDGPDVVDTYIDFMCPYCNQFEQSEGETIQGLIESGDITLNVHPVSILDRLSNGTEYSSRSAGAMYAVAAADPDNAYAFLEAMYENQPAENSDGLSDDQIIQIAKDAGVNVTSDLEDAITSGEYTKYAQSQSLPDGETGTPTLVVNDEIISITYDPQADILANLSS